MHSKSKSEVSDSSRPASYFYVPAPARSEDVVGKVLAERISKTSLAYWGGVEACRGKYQGSRQIRGKDETRGAWRPNWEGGTEGRTG